MKGTLLPTISVLEVCPHPPLDTGSVWHGGGRTALSAAMQDALRRIRSNHMTEFSREAAAGAAEAASECAEFEVLLEVGPFLVRPERGRTSDPDPAF
ncbi:hypothetical protein [Nocardia nova]|uniref:hypothetical protein n=1 Tax=Nocardia nova TaxID=37330 RepID=UPI0011DDB35F|nr:hypothetical protein [Nocardia nova]